MPGRGTPKRPIRIPDALWQAALATAKRRGETVADVVRAALERYVAENGEDLDHRQED
ncbi:MAG TPA: hypothetical protein VFT67_17695 [Jatrophihabitantaceae bacterium]|nr:hypothetical protein [Jatrophihabitantaceae bacterium]